MTGENGVPVTPDWVLPPREPVEELTIPPNVTLASE